MSARQSRAGFLGLLALALAACTSGGAAPAAPAPAATQPAAASKPAAVPTAVPAPATIELGMVVPVAHYWGLWIADDRGFLRDEGLTVEITVTETPSKAIQALAGGSLDITGGPPDAVVLANQRGADLAIVAGQNNRAAYSFIVGGNVQGYPDLRGKQFAVSDLQDGSVVLMRRMLSANGIRPEEYSLVPVGGSAARVGAVQNGQAAGAMVGQPQDFRAVDAGLKRLGFSTSVAPNYLFEVAAVRRDWARANEDRLVRYLRAYARACRWLYDPANRAEAIRILAAGTRTDEAVAEKTYALYIDEMQAIPRNGEVSLPGMAAVLEAMLDVGTLEGPAPPPERFVDESYLRKATGQ
jgi:ABC-type nitrate/sulfonate/bicarbonate transport system substrate-binding protein